MHVNVHVSKIFRFRPNLAVATADKAERGLNRFLHHFADVTCECHVSFSGITRRFNVQDFTAGRRVSQSGDNTGLARFQSGFAHVLGRAQHFRQ